MNKGIENPAVSVIDEAANKFYQGFDNMPIPIRKKLSCEMMHNVFKHMVIPALDEVRRLDRKASIEIIGMREPRQYSNIEVAKWLEDRAETEKGVIDDN
tara:strand:+ start:43 stop:339 length:297 start_codon:yes stop_codon:yes gene_type:complete